MYLQIIVDGSVFLSNISKADDCVEDPMSEVFDSFVLNVDGLLKGQALCYIA